MSSTDPLFEPVVIDAVTASRSARHPPPSHLPPLANWALFLDLDGTLCDYRDDPADVALTPTLRATLSLLATCLDHAICIISGRSADDLDHILGALKLPRIAEHGGAGAADHDRAYQVQLLAVEILLAEIAALNPGTWVERKPSSCVLHYRQVPERAERLRAELAPLVAKFDRLRLLDGVLVFEFAARDRDKGTALIGQMQLPPFVARIPVVVGDDVTDEDAFVAAIELGGFGVGVGTRHSLAARYHLDDATAVRRWLGGLIGGRDA
jgi:trehalose 6-phosphate phosphatase